MRVMKKEKIFMDVTEVAEVLDVSESYAYKLIRKMNVELKENGFITIGGKMNYFYQLVDDLRYSLRNAGAESVLVKNGNNYAVDVEQLDCDYLKYLRTGKPEFCGEYMSQYSWAEETCALLFRKGSK